MTDEVISVNDTPSQSYRMSLAIWDHKTCHPTPANTPRVNQSRRDGRLSWPMWPVIYRDGLPAHRRSPIQVLTQQCTAGSRTRDLLITSPTP